MHIRKGKQYNPFQYLAQAFYTFMMGALVLSCIFALNHFKLSRYFPIKTVRIFGISRLDQQEVQEMLLPMVSGGFFNANVEYIRDRFVQMPWVADTFVRRTWPDQVEVTVLERKAIAQWNRQSLLSEAGEIFAPKLESYPADLPVFLGPGGKQMMMLEYFYKMNRLCRLLHAKISSLELTPYFAWNLTLDNGLTLRLGHKDVLTRLDHFVKVYPKIVGNRAAEVDYVDLRYPNGMAVRWKEVTKNNGIPHTK